MICLDWIFEIIFFGFVLALNDGIFGWLRVVWGVGSIISLGGLRIRGNFLVNLDLG